MRTARIFRLAAVALAAFLLLAGSALAAEVAQGKVVAKAQNSVDIEEYDTNFSKESPYGKPTAVISAFDTTEAKIGIPPETGDILRIAYVFENGKRNALKVMNVSKQDLRKK